MTDITIFADTLFGQAEAAHLTRASLSNARPKALHRHDFFEVFWVQNGRVRHHLPQSSQDLTEGDLAFVGPAHRHALQGRSEEALVVSIAFRADLIRDMGARFPDCAGRLFWANQPDPVIVHRDSHQLADLNRAALRLERARRTPLEAEAFLLPLCAGLLEEERSRVEGAPDWLVQACAAAQDPKVFRDGAAGFVRAAGKAHAHVSRVARSCLGRSPSVYVNDIRMVWAARKLAGTNDSLADIAAECGLPNLSHFHRLFRVQHGITPHQYRRAMQRDVVQPEE